MFLPVADRGTPIAISPSIMLALKAATPIRYIIRLSTLNSEAVFTAEPRAMPKSTMRYTHSGPLNSGPAVNLLLISLQVAKPL